MWGLEGVLSESTGQRGSGHDGAFASAYPASLRTTEREASLVPMATVLANQADLLFG
jgi:hypothetical protein